MATVTKTFTENESSSYKATWTISFELPDQTITPNGSTNPTFAIPTVKAKMVNANKNRGEIGISPVFVIGGMKFIANFSRSGTFVSGTTYTLTLNSLNLFSGSDGNGFVSGSKLGIYNNKIQNVFASNVSQKDFAVYISDIYLSSWYGSGYDRQNVYSGSWSGNGTLVSNSISKLKLNAPPTFNSGVLIPNTSGYWDNNITTASCTVSGSAGKYGATITASSLTIGEQVATGTGDGTLSITLNRAGPFTPTLKVTDSRGQIATGTLDPITVQQYIRPSAEFSVFRCNSSGVRADEGSYGLITATIDYTSEIATLQAPIVKINDTLTNNVTWYSDSELTTQITDWSNVASGSPVYGLINGSFSITSSYVITLIAQDQYSQADVITQTLSTAFYTIDVQAGGKEISFGAPAIDDVTNFPNGLIKSQMGFVLVLDTDSASSLDSLLYNKIISNGWGNDVIVLDANSTPMVNVLALLSKLTTS